MTTETGKLVAIVSISALTIFIVAASVYYKNDTVYEATSLSTTFVKLFQPNDKYSGIYGLYKQSKVSQYATENYHSLVKARQVRKTECGLIKAAAPIDCEVCGLLVDGLLDLVKKGSTQDDVVEFATYACINLRIEDERVCQKVIVEFKDELFGVLINLGYKPDEVCGMVLGSNCGKPWNPQLSWNVTFPATPKPPHQPPQPPKAGSPTLRVLHITDFHFDAAYTAGTNAECGEPLCCRADDGPPAPGHAGAGKYGDYRNCDTAKSSLDTLFQHLSSIQEQFDYVVFTGDIPAHNVWEQSREDQINALNNYLNYMKKYLPNKTVFNTLGNHESAPVNSFPPPFITGNNSESWFYDALVPVWRQWLPQDTEATIRKGGFYSVAAFPGLRIISLNMNMCNNGNWWLYINDTDPAGMLQWFITELQAAEDKGEKVHVLGHIMPGCDCCLKAFSWNYYKIISRYESTIVEQFFGHSHANYYEMFYDVETLSRPISVAYIPGSITTYSFLNPGFRIYEIDGNYKGSSWRVQDYTNYFLNLTDANLNDNAVWQKEYSAKEEFGLSSLFPQDWSDLIYKMKKDDSAYANFCNHYWKSAPNNCTGCTGSCKTGLLCELKSARNGDTDICRDLQQ